VDLGRFGLAANQPQQALADVPTIVENSVINGRQGWI
jgi:hypothetical protein